MAMPVPAPPLPGVVGEETVHLKTGDEKEFVVPRKLADMFVTIKYMLEDGFSSHAVPVPNVMAEHMAPVIEYCKYHLEHPALPGSVDAPLSVTSNNDMGRDLRYDDLCDWDKAFLKQQSEAVFYGVLIAANYLEVKPLLDACCRYVAESLKGKTADEIRTRFNIKNDFTPEEEDQLRKENEWTDSIVAATNAAAAAVK